MNLKEEMEREAMVETIAEQETLIETLTTALQSAIDDPTNWLTHIKPALDRALYRE